MPEVEARATLVATLTEDVGRNNLSKEENAWLPVARTI